MLDNIRKMVKRNGHPANGNGTNGHGSNGRDLDVEGVTRPGSYCRSTDNLGKASADSILLETEITVSDDFAWTLEVRQDQGVLGTMHSHNPFVLISLFRDYTIFYGDPHPPFAVWLRHRNSTRGAPMTTQFGEGVWLDFLRKLDPEIEDKIDDTRATTERSSMFNRHGQPTNPDTVLEKAFGIA